MNLESARYSSSLIVTKTICSYFSNYRCVLENFIKEEEEGEKKNTPKFRVCSVFSLFTLVLRWYA